MNSDFYNVVAVTVVYAMRFMFYSKAEKNVGIFLLISILYPQIRECFFIVSFHLYLQHKDSYLDLVICFALFCVIFSKRNWSNIKLVFSNTFESPMVFIALSLFFSSANWMMLQTREKKQNIIQKKNKKKLCTVRHLSLLNNIYNTLCILQLLVCYTKQIFYMFESFSFQQNITLSIVSSINVKIYKKFKK